MLNIFGFNCFFLCSIKDIQKIQAISAQTAQIHQEITHTSSFPPQFMPKMKCCYILCYNLNTQLMSEWLSDEEPQYLVGYMGVVSALIFSSLGAAYGSYKAASAIIALGTVKPELVIKSMIPIVMAQVLGIYGIIMAVIIEDKIPASNYSDRLAYSHLAAGLCCGLSGLVSGLAIGKIADDGIRALATQKLLFVGLVVMLIFAQSLGLYGLIVSLIIASP